MIADNIKFSGMPERYNRINNILSRSAQPKEEDFVWLKEQGITDIIDLKSGFENRILNFDEQKVVENLGLKYHNIKINAIHPDEETIDEFLSIVKETEANNGKLHIHCLQGVDRTGMLSFIYKMLNSIGDLKINIKEWLDLGHNKILFPNLVDWATDFVNKKRKSKNT